MIVIPLSDTDQIEAIKKSTIYAELVDRHESRRVDPNDVWTQLFRYEEEGGLARLSNGTYMICPGNGETFIVYTDCFRFQVPLNADVQRKYENISKS